MNNPIELILISGFLGAGKTTFLRRLLALRYTRKFGVLVNEFGDIAVDGKTIDRDGIEYTEVSGGSIFCSCIKADFVKAMASLQQTDIDVLVIENSGLADPSSVQSLLEEMQPHFKRGYAYRGAVCIVDCTTFLKYEKMLPPLQNQVRSADFVILNKTDLTGSEAIAQAKARVAALNGSAPIAAAVRADVPVQQILQQLSPHGFAGETTNHPWTRPSVYALAAPGELKKAAVTAFVRELSHHALRVKGFVPTESGWVHIDAVETDPAVRPAADTPDALQSARGIVVIGKTQDPLDEVIDRLWRRHFDAAPLFIETD